MNPRSLVASGSKFRRPLSAIPSSSVDLDPLRRLHHKDWLAPNEVIKIIKILRDPNSIIGALNQYEKRKDYKPNEALFALAIDRLAQAEMFDPIEDIMRRIVKERPCRLSDEFFHNVIKIYGNAAGRINRAIETLYDMPKYNVWPSVKCFNYVLNLLVSWKLFDAVREVYMRGPQLGIEIDACCLNILIKGLCKNGSLEAAFQLLDEFPKQRCRPNVKTFSTLMHGLCEQGKVDDAKALLDRMENEGIFPDTITFNILISGLRKQEKVAEAMELLERMKLKGCQPNAGSYQEVLYGLLDEGRFLEAKEFMAEMISAGINPSFVSYKLVIRGLCKEKLVGNVDWVLRRMVEQGFVPKMGMWRQILQSMFSRHACDVIFRENLLESGSLGEEKNGTDEHFS